MSYILDALRRAEAERERGSVPGLHSPGLPVAGAPPLLPVRAAPRPVLLWVAGALALAVLGALLGAWWVRSPAPTPGTSDAGAAIADARTAPAAAPSALPPALASASPSPPPSATGPVILPTPDAPPVPLRLPTPPEATAPRAPVATPELAPPPAAAPNPATAPGGRPAGAAPTTALEAVPTVALAALSAEQRAAWPPLVIGGSIYSDSPSSRFIIANGQVVREGESAAPGVVVERIERSRVLLRWRGLRVDVPV